MKRSTRIRIAHTLTSIVKPCHMYGTTRGAKRDYVVCGYDNSRRKYCGTRDCPHFRPTLRYRIARHFGMVR